MNKIIEVSIATREHICDFSYMKQVDYILYNSILQIHIKIYTIHKVTKSWLCWCLYAMLPSNLIKSRFNPNTGWSVFTSLTFETLFTFVNTLLPCFPMSSIHCNKAEKVECDKYIQVSKTKLKYFVSVGAQL